MTDRPNDLDIVTGAFSYSGAAIAAELVTGGRRVRTLTGHPERRPSAIDIDMRPLDFTDPAELTASMRGAHTRARGGSTTTRRWRTAAPCSRPRPRAGIQRIVHVSITHPSLESPYPYFRGKAHVEQILHDLGISHAIVRPAILFGGDGVLINDVAWRQRTPWSSTRSDHRATATNTARWPTVSPTPMRGYRHDRPDRLDPRMQHNSADGMPTNSTAATAGH